MKFTLRRMMLLIAMAALASGGVVSAVRLNELSFDYQRWSADAAEKQRARYAQSFPHASEMWRGFLAAARRSREKAREYRRKQVEALDALDAKRSAGLPTTQQERREPWYWGMRADESEWAGRVAETRAAILEGKISDTLEDYQPPAPPRPGPPPQ